MLEARSSGKFYTDHLTEGKRSMIKRKSNESSGVVLQPLVYRFIFSKPGAADSIERGEAQLTSPALDSRMHKTKSVLVVFGFDSENSQAGKIALDSFQLHSLSEYLRNQKRVREALEKALDRHRVQWDLIALGSGARVWKDVRIAAVYIDIRRTITRAQTTENCGSMRYVGVERV